MVRTSLTHPLQIDEVAVSGGVIGMTFCPGKQGDSVYGAPWARDLDLDMQRIAEWRPDAVVTLMESHEFTPLGVRDLPAAMLGLDAKWLHLPIRDVSIPDDEFERLWAGAGSTLRRILRKGGRVLVHCRGGLGRTGLVAAKLLIELGTPVEEAIRKVRGARPGTIETPEQERYVQACSPLPPDGEEADGPPPSTSRIQRQQQHTVQGRFLGCLLGGAVGDALGAPVEFMTRIEILKRFGADGIERYAPAYGGLGRITDDTQMTLFTAEGLIRGWVRGCFKGVSSHAGVVAHAYLRWLATQGERPDRDIGFGADQPGWLFQQRELHSRRAPGNTCLAALRAMPSLAEPARNESKGCGGVMRVAPVGLFAWRLCESPLKTFELGSQLAALTHGHPTGSRTAGVLAVLILALLDGASLTEALAAAKEVLRTEAGFEETLQAIETAEALAAGGLAHDQAIVRLGQGWVAEEALAIAIYCALVARDFRHGVILAVNHDGDSDSSGSITGNLLGAMHGVNTIPAEWLEPLELRDVITEVAEDLYEFKNWKIGEYADDTELNQRIWRKYPGF